MRLRTRMAMISLHHVIYGTTIISVVNSHRSILQCMTLLNNYHLPDTEVGTSYGENPGTANTVHLEGFFVYTEKAETYSFHGDMVQKQRKIFLR